ncbi:MAG TPA: hypothetical protein VFH31_14990 [Pyrinomonadaceae bacterium]|nr:hypothetical protein [Pyrinomonadaceae bacterium]
MKVQKIIASLLIFAAAHFCLASEQAQQGIVKPDLNGMWVLEETQSRKNDGSQANVATTLVISQTRQEIKITRKIHEKGKERVQQLTYYSDARGETNPTSDGTDSLKSNTKWSGKKLIIRFLIPSNTVNRNAVVNERVDEWKLSDDGQKLTQTSSFTSSSSATDASNSPYSSPRGPNIFSSPLRWKETRTYKRHP